MSDKREIKRLARTLAALERRIDSMQTPQLHRASIEDGAIKEYDDEGNLVGIIGRQDDGSHAYVVLTGPEPPIPDKPVVVVKPGFFRAGWNGKFVDDTTYVVDEGIVAPADFARVEAHVGDTAAFTPDTGPESETRVGSFESPRGGMVTQIVEPGTYFVRLVTVSAAGKVSAASVAVEVEVEPALDQSELIADLEALELSLSNLDSALTDLQNVTLPALESRLGDAEDAVEAVQLALPGLESRLDDAEGDISDLVNTTLPALDSRLTDAEGDIDDLVNETLPGLDSRLGDAEFEIAQVRDNDLAQVREDLLMANLRLDNVTEWDIPMLYDRMDEVQGIELPAAKARLDAAESAIETTLPTAIQTAQQAADKALLIAPVSMNAPTPEDGAGRPVDAVWTQVNASGDAVGFYRWDGVEWQPLDLSPTVIPNLSAGKITSGTIDTARLNAGQIAAAIATIIELNADRITSGTIDVDRLNVADLAVAIATVIELNADQITAGTIDTARLNAAEIAAAVATVIELNADRITAGTISVDRLNTNAIAAAVATVIELNADRITSGTIDVDRLNTNAIAAAVASVIELNADRITSGTIDVERLNAQDIAAAVATVIELNADRITSGTIDVERLDAIQIAAAVATIIELNADRITSGTIDTDRLNAVEIAAAVATIIELNADRITSGTIDTDRLNASEIAAAVANIITVKAENIIAGDIEAKLRLVAGAEVQVGYEDEEHVLIDPATGVEYRIPGPDTDGTSEPIPVSRMGRSYAVIDPASGDTLAALTEEGDVTGIDAEFDTLSVGGADITEVLDERPLGIVAASGVQSTEKGPYSTATGVWELPLAARAGRRYTLRIHGQVVGSNGFVIGRFTATQSTSGNPSAPLVTSSTLGPWLYWRGVTSFSTVYGEYTFVAPTDSNYRILFFIQPQSGSQVRIREFEFSIRDDGVAPEAVGRASLGGATGSPAPDPTPPPQTYDEQYWFDWSASYNRYGRSSAENYVGSGKMRQGKDAYTNNPYAAALRIPNAARSRMMGASKVEVWVRLTHAGPYSSGTPRFGRHTSSASSPPSSMPTIYTGWTASKALAKGGTYWYKLPASWEAGWKAGTYYGITLGDTQSAYSFMDFYNATYGDTSKRARLRIRVTK